MSLLFVFDIQGMKVSEGNKQDEKSFTEMFEKFAAAFNNKNISELNEYINPEYGLFILDNPGAFSVANYFDSFDSIFSNPKETDMYRIKNIKISCSPEYGVLPHYNCDGSGKEGWDKTGCFYKLYTEKKPVSRYIYFADRNGKYGPDDQDKAEDYQRLYSGLSRSLENSEFVFYSTLSDIGFYFVVRNERMFLVMTDLVTPCSA